MTTRNEPAGRIHNASLAHTGTLLCPRRAVGSSRCAGRGGDGEGLAEAPRRRGNEQIRRGFAAPALPPGPAPAAPAANDPVKSIDENRVHPSYSQREQHQLPTLP